MEEITNAKNNYIMFDGCLGSCLSGRMLPKEK